MEKKKMSKWFFVVIPFVVALLLGIGVYAMLPNMSGVEGLELDCYVDEAGQEGMDSSLFYRNDLTVFGGDADVIWVSEEEGGEEYGGYFYMYTSGNDGVFLNDYGTYRAACTVLRSRDLNDWELCGQTGGENGIVDDGEGDDISAGFCVWIDKDEWVQKQFWAPEVIYNEADQKYYMYANAMGLYRTDDTDPDWTCNDRATDETQWDRFYCAILMSDTPVGPFKLATSERYYGVDGEGNPKANPYGEVVKGENPQINVTSHFELSEVFAVIDFSPFYDENGDLYLYFVRHISTGHDHNCIWGVKMKDMVTPDWNTLTMLAACDYQTVEKKPGTTAPVWDESGYELKGQFAKNSKLCAYTDAFTGEEVSEEDNKYHREGIINEGPHVICQKGRYFMCYSPLGVTSYDYDTLQCYAESPLGPFKKLPKDQSMLMGRSATEDQMTGTGHNALVEVDGEIFCIYYAQANPVDASDTSQDGRIYGVDRIQVIDDPEFGTLLHGNGPTKSIQPKPSVTTGVRNIATEAKVKATNVNGDTLSYVNDGLFVRYNTYEDWELSVDGKTTITFTFDEPRSIRGVMVYNSMDYSKAFSQIDSIVFDLEERPSWYVGKGYNGKAYIKDIPFNTDYVNSEGQFIRSGGAATVSFDEIKVNSVTITISEKIVEENEEIRISDIVILGN